MSVLVAKSSNTSNIMNMSTSGSNMKKGLSSSPQGSRSKRAAPVVESSEAELRSSRRRIKTTRFDTDFLDNEEQRLLQQVYCTFYVWSCVTVL